MRIIFFCVVLREAEYMSVLHQMLQIDGHARIVIWARSN